MFGGVVVKPILRAEVIAATAFMIAAAARRIKNISVLINVERETMQVVTLRALVSAASPVVSFKLIFHELTIFSVSAVSVCIGVSGRYNRYKRYKRYKAIHYFFINL